MGEILLTNPEAPEKEKPQRTYEEVTFDQLLRDISGEDEYGRAKASVMITYAEAKLVEDENGEYFPDVEDANNRKKQTAMSAPVVDLYMTMNPGYEGEYAIAELTFPQDKVTAMRHAWNEISDYMKSMSTFVYGSRVYPILSVLVIPNRLPDYYKDHEMYILEMVNPIYVGLSSDMPGFPSNKFSFIFPAGACNMIKNEELPNGSIIDELNKEIARNLEAKRLMEEERERKEERRRREFEAIKEERAKNFRYQENEGKVLVGRAAERKDGKKTEE